MRKRYRVLFLAALAAALIVPVGYALSIESTTKTASQTYAVVMPAAANVVAARAMIQRTGEAQPASPLGPVGDAAKLLCIGTVLFGLAAAVRKVI
jgi:hypothetical protein